jgi:predicted RNA methylase
VVVWGEDLTSAIPEETWRVLARGTVAVHATVPAALTPQAPASGVDSAGDHDIVRAMAIRTGTAGHPDTVFAGSELDPRVCQFGGGLGAARSHEPSGSVHQLTEESGGGHFPGTDGVFALATNDARGLLAVGLASGEVLVFRANHGQPERSPSDWDRSDRGQYDWSGPAWRCKASDDIVRAVTFTADGSALVVATWDGVLCEFELPVLAANRVDLTPALRRYEYPEDQWLPAQDTGNFRLDGSVDLRRSRGMSTKMRTYLALVGAAGADDTANEVRHLTMDGTVLRFLNPPDLYPVNHFQSLILASASEIAATAIAARRGTPLSGLAAWEPCCGGGPAAVTLKRLGVGYVQASDIGAESIRACAANAAANDVRLDRVVQADLLADAEHLRYDLICANPPCGPNTAALPNPDAIVKAVQGGRTGIEVTRRLLEQASARLTARGSLLFVVVSVMDVFGLMETLDELFPGRWRTFPTTPVAAPYRPSDHPTAAWLSNPDNAHEPIVWKRNDGWFWRLTWVVEVMMAPPGPLRSGLPLCPYGFEVSEDVGLRRMVEKFSSDGFWLDRRPPVR